MDKYRDTIENKILLLNTDKKIMFSLLICKRLLPNYIYFSNKFKFGNPSDLESVIFTLFKNLMENKENNNIDNLIKKIENNTPNTEDFNTIFVSFALDACTSILSILYYLKDDDINNIVDIATYARDTVDMYIQERDNLIISKELEFLIENDILMLNEKKRQLDVINYLNNIDSVSQVDLDKLSNFGEEKIIDLSLLDKS